MHMAFRCGGKHRGLIIPHRHTPNLTTTAALKLWNFVRGDRGLKFVYCMILHLLIISKWKNSSRSLFVAIHIIYVNRKLIKRENKVRMFKLSEQGTTVAWNFTHYHSRRSQLPIFPGPLFTFPRLSPCQSPAYGCVGGGVLEYIKYQGTLKSTVVTPRFTHHALPFSLEQGEPGILNMTDSFIDTCKSFGVHVHRVRLHSWGDGAWHWDYYEQ